MTAVAAEPVPIELDAEDVGGIRIPLETVITAYDEGPSPDELPAHIAAASTSDQQNTERGVVDKHT
jgi:hypothetical protein